MTAMAESSGSGSDTGVRLVVLNLPEDEGEGLGFRLTRTLWDPYPWVREVTPESRADVAGLKTGDCLLQTDGKDLLGLPVGQVAGMIRGDGTGRGVSLLVWNCGVDPKDDPELLWSCGGGSRGEKSRRALSGVVKALSCCVCAATATKPLNCARSHLYCEACWMRLERCALCREQLPSKDSPYARNLVAEQVFEAIATEYELKHSIRRPKETASAYTSPNRSPMASPALSRKGQYQISMMNRKKVQFSDRYRPAYCSDPNLHRSVKNSVQNYQMTNPTEHDSGTRASASNCHFKLENKHVQTSSQTDINDIPQISIENVDTTNKPVEIHSGKEMPGSCKNYGYPIDICQKVNCQSDCKVSNCQSLGIQHMLMTQLRQACSLADLQNASLPNSQVSRSLNNLGESIIRGHHSSLDNLKDRFHNASEIPVLLLPAPPVYVLTCEHKQE